MASKTASAIQKIGEMRAGSWNIAVTADCDSVKVQVLGVCVLRFTSSNREQFQRLFTEAERHAEAWAAEHTQTGATQ